MSAAVPLWPVPHVKVAAVPGTGAEAAARVHGEDGSVPPAPACLRCWGRPCLSSALLDWGTAVRGCLTTPRAPRPRRPRPGDAWRRVACPAPWSWSLAWFPNLAAVRDARGDLRSPLLGPLRDLKLQGPRAFTERVLQSVKAGSHRLDFVRETPRRETCWASRPGGGEAGVGGGGLLRTARSLGFLHLKAVPPLVLLRKRGLLLPGVCCELNPSWPPVLFTSNRPQTAWVGVSVSRGRRVVGTALAHQPLSVNRFKVSVGFPPQGFVGLSAFSLSGIKTHPSDWLKCI